MPWQGQVHDAIDGVELARIMADQQRRQLFQPGADTLAKRRQISHSPGTTLAPARDTFVGIDADDGRIEQFKFESTAGQPVGFV